MFNKGRKFSKKPVYFFSVSRNVLTHGVSVMSNIWGS